MQGRLGWRLPVVQVRCALWLCTALLSACASGLHLERSAYPPTVRVGVVDNYHGNRVADPYRWLEGLDSAATTQWVNAQNQLSLPYLKALPQRTWVQQRLTQLYRYERYGVPRRVADRYFFVHNDGQQNQAALYVAISAADAGRRLIDPDTVRGDATVALADFEPSPDGRLLAYSLSDAGSDWKSWYVREVDTGADRPDVLRQIKFSKVSWALDGSGFYYSSYPEGNEQLQPIIHFHKLGQPQAEDARIYAFTGNSTSVPDGRVSDDGRYLVITLDDGTFSNAVNVLALDGSGHIQALFAPGQGMYIYVGSRRGVGTELLFRTTAGAARGAVLAVDLGKPADQRVRVLVPEEADVLDQAALVGSRLYLTYLKDAHALVRSVDAATGAPKGELALPGLGTVSAFSGDGNHPEGYFGYSDFFTPTRIYRVDASDGAVQLLRQPAIAADLPLYETEQIFYRSKDGTRVPMFLVHKRGLQRDGRNPVMLYGYGGFDISMTPSFAPSTLAWLEMGGVYAVANLRGGGEYGAQWHLAGTRSNKQNVFDDFIAAAEYLIAQRYTVPQRLVIRGGSNGGLLVGAVLTQRPDLFGAALPDVGVMDMLRYHLASANARLWSDDYGLSEQPEDFKALWAYSPYHNAWRHPCYPPTLVTTAAHDNRVVPWHSFKFAAALQSAQQCARPVLIRVETRAGHGAGKPTWMQVEQLADQWAFAAAALGMDEPPSR